MGGSTKTLFEVSSTVSEKVTFLGVEGFGGFERGSKGVEGLESVGESKIFKVFLSIQIFYIILKQAPDF